MTTKIILLIETQIMLMVDIRLIHNMTVAQRFIPFRHPASPTVISSICEWHCILMEVADGMKWWSRSNSTPVSELQGLTNLMASYFS